MSLSDLASLGSFVSGIAVLISLIYLAQQVRQADKNQRALVLQARSTRLSDLLLRVAEPDWATAYLKGMRGEDLSAVELLQFRHVSRALLAHSEDTFLQHQERLLSPAAYNTFHSAMKGAMSALGRRAMWRMERHRYDAGFQSYVDQVVAEGSPDWQGDGVDEWRAAVAAGSNAASQPAR